MTRAAKQADVMVPVIAGTSVETGGDWAKNIIRDEWSTKISSAIITKLDVVESKSLLRRNLPVILKKCELLARNGCILFCDSLTGLEAMKLQRLLEEIERKYAQKKTPKEGQEEENAIPKESWEDENAILTAAITNKENSLNRVSLCNHWYYDAAPNLGSTSFTRKAPSMPILQLKTGANLWKQASIPVKSVKLVTS